MKRVFRNQHLQMFGLKLNKHQLFSSSWIVGRDSETQVQVSRNINCIYYIYLVQFSPTWICASR